METLIYLEKGIIDISDEKFSTQENNSQVSDVQYTSFMLPFTRKNTPELKRIIGDYSSHESHNLENKLKCQILHENKVRDAELNITTVEGDDITFQIDFGFENLPNAEKKLSELPLEDFDVDDIHTYAKSICGKTWPLTNFNFPRIFTTKYAQSDEVWRDFDGYLNDLTKDGSEMRRNYIQEDGEVRNINIIHPCPHPLYLLKTGFADAGLQLAGDILTDPLLQNKWVYSGTDYFSTLTQRRLGLNIRVMDFQRSYKNKKRYYPVGEYDQSFTIPKAGKYKLMSSIMLATHYSGLGSSYIRIYLNGIQIFSDSAGDEKIFNWNTDIDVAAGSVIRVEGTRSYGEGDTEVFCQIELFSKDIYSDEEQDGEDNGVVTNLNKIQLKKAVPDMSFQEYVNVFRNWFNYDVDVVNKTVFMNRNGKAAVPDVKDFKKFESVNPPVRNLLNKRSFLLKFPDMDEGNSKDNMYYDYNGAKLNGTPKTDTSIIEIRGYVLPISLPKAGGYNTAKVLKDASDLVSLVEYNGLINGQNNAVYTRGCDFPDLFPTNWENWFRRRVNGVEYIWKKIVDAEEFSQYTVKDTIYCFNNEHIIKTIEKDKLSRYFYDLQITTETNV